MRANLSLVTTSSIPITTYTIYFSPVFTGKKFFCLLNVQFTTITHVKIRHLSPLRIQTPETIPESVFLHFSHCIPWQFINENNPLGLLEFG